MRLQGMGNVDAVAASEIKVGDVLMWNYGYTSTVVAIRKTTKCIVLTELCGDGKTYERRRGSDSEVCRIN